MIYWMFLQQICRPTTYDSILNDLKLDNFTNVTSVLMRGQCARRLMRSSIVVRLENQIIKRKRLFLAGRGSKQGTAIGQPVMDTPRGYTAFGESMNMLCKTCQ